MSSLGGALSLPSLLPIGGWARGGGWLGGAGRAAAVEPLERGTGAAEPQAGERVLVAGPGRSPPAFEASDEVVGITPSDSD